MLPGIYHAHDFTIASIDAWYLRLVLSTSRDSEKKIQEAAHRRIIQIPCKPLVESRRRILYEHLLN